MKKIKINWPKFIIVFITISFIIAFIFREPIMEYKYSKAKIEIFNTLLLDDPKSAKENIKTILDSLTSDEQKKEVQ